MISVDFALGRIGSLLLPTTVDPWAGKELENMFVWVESMVAGSDGALVKRVGIVVVTHEEENGQYFAACVCCTKNTTGASILQSC